MQNKKSVYLKILEERLEPILYEDKNWFVILAREPINEGHLLVIPKKLSKKFYEIADVAEGFKIATKFAKRLQSVYKPPRVSLFVKGFTVEQHAHIHVLPVYSRNDMSKEKADLEKISLKQMQEVADKIKL